MITSPEYSLTKIKKAIQFHKPDFVCYRNKEYFDKKEIIEFINFAKKYSKVIIHYTSLKDKELINLVDGIHYPSNFLKPIKDKINIASTHNLEEIKKAKNFDYITLSPLFDSKGRKGMGIKKFNSLAQHHPRVFALGGIISKKEIEEVNKTLAIGFASIRYFFQDIT
jgi:thiamine-phosphate pyrophosphorylase